jgi:hypothetical protein
MTATPTTTDALAERDALLDQAVTVEGRAVEHRDKQKAAEQARNEAENALAQARIGEARGTATAADVTKATTAREKAAAAVVALHEEGETLIAAQNAIERDLWRLHWHNRPAFEQEAHEAAERAEEALAALADQAQEAAQLWHEANARYLALQRQLMHGSAPALGDLDPMTYYRPAPFPIDAASITSATPNPFRRPVEAKPNPWSLDA